MKINDRLGSILDASMWLLYDEAVVYLSDTEGPVPPSAIERGVTTGE
jgi:hypothetical protein